LKSILTSLEVNYELDQDSYPTLDPTQQQTDLTSRTPTALQNRPHQPSVLALREGSAQPNEGGKHKGIKNSTSVTPSSLPHENNSSIDCIDCLPSTPVSDPGRGR